MRQRDKENRRQREQETERKKSETDRQRKKGVNKMTHRDHEIINFNLLRQISKRQERKLGQVSTAETSMPSKITIRSISDKSLTLKKKHFH
jgi:hypothetical protein